MLLDQHLSSDADPVDRRAPRRCLVAKPSLGSLSGFGSAIILAAPPVFATDVQMALALAGRRTIDLAVGLLMAFINVSAVSLKMAGMVTGTFRVFFVVLVLGVLHLILFALIVTWVRVQPIIVALSGFLALSSINLVIVKRPGGMEPDGMASGRPGATIASRPADPADRRRRPAAPPP